MNDGNDTCTKRRKWIRRAEVLAGITALFAGISAPVLAQRAPGSGPAAAGGAQTAAGDWYIGLQLGRSSSGLGGSDIDGALAGQGIAGATSLSGRDTAGGLSLGYRLTPRFAVEAAYNRLGQYGYTSVTTTPAADTLTGEYKASAWSLAAVGTLPLASGWSAYGKLGLAHTTTDLISASTTGITTPLNTSASTTGLLIGTGVTYDFSKSLFGKAGWDRYARVGEAAATGRTNIDLYSVGIGVRF